MGNALDRSNTQERAMAESMRILVSGASGLIGRSMTEALQAAGHSVTTLVRRESRTADEYEWNPYQGFIDSRALKGLDAVVHLSGAGIGDKRWTEERKKVLYDSRIVTTRVLSEHLAALDDPPGVLISQSAIGIYGDRGDETLTESSSRGPSDDFLASLTFDWETAAAPAAEAGIRVVYPRTGLVLSRRAQLMVRLVPLFRAGLGGPIGDGRQWWSWITLTDVIRSVAHLIESDLEGPFNLAAPAPARQKHFAELLARAVHRPAVLPVPKLAIRLALGGEKAESIGLSSTRVLPERLVDDGFEFGDADLETTLHRMLG